MGAELRGQTAVVTGGSQGLGLAIAKRLLGDGANVSLWDVEEAGSAPGRRRTWPCRPRAYRYRRCRLRGMVAAARDTTLGRFGTVSILVNNAGVSGPHAKAWELSLADWQRVIDVNMTGVFLCCRALTPAMLANGLRPHRQHRLGCRQGSQPLDQRVCDIEGRGHRLHQDAGPRTCRHQDHRKLRHAGGDQDCDLRQMAGRLRRHAACQDSDGPLRPARRTRCAGRVDRLARRFVQHRRGVRPFWRTDGLLRWAAQPHPNGTTRCLMP